MGGRVLINPTWDAELERRGIDAIRALLLHPDAAGPAQSAPVAGLRAADGKDMPRQYAEEWLRRKDEERRLLEATDRRWLKTGAWAAIIGAWAAIAAAVIAALAWWFPR
jgi:hypothetical protein